MNNWSLSLANLCHPASFYAVLAEVVVRQAVKREAVLSSCLMQPIHSEGDWIHVAWLQCARMCLLRQAELFCLPTEIQDLESYSTLIGCVMQGVS